MDNFFDVVRVKTFRSEIHIKFTENNLFNECIKLCQEYLKKYELDFIVSKSYFIDNENIFDGMTIRINNDPSNPEEEAILKKHTFSLSFKIRSEIKNCRIYAVYDDTSFIIEDKKV